MFQHYFELVDGVQIYPVFSLLVFVIFFSIAIFRFFKADKSYLSEMEKIPLSEVSNSKSNIEKIL